MARTRLLDRSIDELDLDEETKVALLRLSMEWELANAERMAEMASAINRQAAAVERLQASLQTLIELLRPELRVEHSGRLPVAFRVADGEASPDVATAQLVADPIALGFTLSQADLARALGLQPATVSVLVRAFRLDEDPDCAVVLRQGKGAKIVNYNPVAVKRFRQRLQQADADTLPRDARAALRRARE